MLFKKLNFVLLLIFVFLFMPFECLNADTLYLKNGREVRGIIASEEAGMISLGVCSGTVQFTKGEIARIEKSSPEEIEAINKKCKEQNIQNQRALLKQEIEKQKRGAKLEFAEDSQSIMLDALINKKVNAKLILDTGAELVMLSKKTAEKLGIDLNKLKSDIQIRLADGRSVNAKYIILDSIKVQDAQAQDVEAAILLDDFGEANLKDGLLGRSYLKRFNFTVDYKNKSLLLEKL